MFRVFLFCDFTVVRVFNYLAVFFSLVLIVDARRRVLGLNKFLVVQTFFNIEVFLFVVPEIDFKLFEFQVLP